MTTNHSQLEIFCEAVPRTAEVSPPALRTSESFG